jgi:NAD(P)-dependent dehydrogenase (short-subunit alcohol dehydrogenase family)
MSVLILGATSRIARELANRYAERGQAVYVAARDADEAGRIAADLRVRHGAQAPAPRPGPAPRPPAPPPAPSTPPISTATPPSSSASPRRSARSTSPSSRSATWARAATCCAASST